jgi:hypothetical protein
LWIEVPSGIFDSGSALPTRMSASSPATIIVPTARPFGARM